MKHHSSHPVIVSDLLSVYNVSTVLVLGLKLTSVTRHIPVEASHSLMVLSRDPDITKGPAA